MESNRSYQKPGRGKTFRERRYRTFLVLFPILSIERFPIIRRSARVLCPLNPPSSTPSFGRCFTVLSLLLVAISVSRMSMSALLAELSRCPFELNSPSVRRSNVSSKKEWTQQDLKNEEWNEKIHRQRIRHIEGTLDQIEDVTSESFWPCISGNRFCSGERNDGSEAGQWMRTPTKTRWVTATIFDTVAAITNISTRENQPVAGNARSGGVQAGWKRVVEVC